MITSLIASSLLLGLFAGPASAPPSASGDLVAALSDADPDIRALAAMLLADEDPTEQPPATAEALRARLTDPKEHWRVRVEAADALAHLDVSNDAVTGWLVGVVLDAEADWRVRAAALEAAGERDGGRAMARALAGREDVRVSNGRSSVSLKQPLDDGSIFDALADPDPRMRLLARTALDSGLELESQDPVPGRQVIPCLGEVFQQVLSQAGSATGTLTIY